MSGVGYIAHDLWNAVVCFQHHCLLIGKVWICDALLYVSLTLQSALESGLVARIVQIDFRTAFDGVGILYRLYAYVLEVLCFLY